MTDTDNLKDVSSSLAMKILNEFMQQNKISTQLHEKLSGMYRLIHDTQTQSYVNEKILPQKQKKIQAEIRMMKENYSQLFAKKEELEAQLKKSMSDVKKAEMEEDAYRKQIEQIQMSLEKYKGQLSELESRINDEIREKNNEIQPKIAACVNEIDKLDDEKTNKESCIVGENKKYVELVEKKMQLIQSNQDIKLEIERNYNEVQQIRDEPNRFQKQADMLHTANEIMNKDLETKKEEIFKKEKEIITFTEKKNLRSSKIKEIEDKIGQTQVEKDVFQTKNKQIKQQIKQLQNMYQNLQADHMNKEIELKSLDRSLRSLLEDISKARKEFEYEIKIKKKEQQVKQTIFDQVREIEISIDKYQKEEQEIKFEIRKQEEVALNIIDEAKLTEFKKRNVESTTSQKQEDNKKRDQQLKELEKQVHECQIYETSLVKNIKMMTALRESMARKASSAMAEVRETREELKIKELLILDLTKKHQETEFKLNSFKALYEEVKSARNKYVNLIQNASQDLAELKERIKILQNELEILKNESSEKDSTLMQYRHLLLKQIHTRDRAHAKLNQQEFLRREKKEIVDQNINEIKKLNMIIMSLEKEMLILRKNYEQACESRNYTGIQLIDRNDELCILYEKSNIQENTLRNGEQEVKKLEDEIRMIRIEISEKKRQIDVARKQIMLVPQLADRVIELKQQLELEKDKERQLSEELENPENKNRWRELKEEEADQEALEAKIHVLEERLNNKKEQLLEKELILDEITNLSEKLRKQALEGRQSTLELSEKLNDFQARLKDITRKMMASISELSIFQANAIKLQQERDELETVVEEAQSRLDQNQAPNLQFEIEYNKMNRDKQRYLEIREQRIQKEQIEKNFPPFTTKTTAEHRVNAYIKDDIGLPQPYGKHAPFMPSEVGANFRHYRKPNIKEIEI